MTAENGAIRKIVGVICRRRSQSGSRKGVIAECFLGTYTKVSIGDLRELPFAIGKLGICCTLVLCPVY